MYTRTHTHYYYYYKHCEIVVDDDENVAITHIHTLNSQTSNNFILKQPCTPQIKKNLTVVVVCVW